MKISLFKIGVFCVIWVIWLSIFNLWGVDTYLFMKIMFGYVVADAVSDLASVLSGVKW